ncbi:MAG: DUF2142 domain-containing protein [Actinobacteria bacterium]|nr:MAG: DUF2142 domain-containing protein [Actinomycetota bacterium]
MSFTPPWQGPDEPQHYDYIHYLQTEKALPVLGKTKLCNQTLKTLNNMNFYEYAQNGKSPYISGNKIKPESRNENTEHKVSSTQLKNATDTAQMNQIAQHPPLYYILGAILLWPFKNSSVLTHIFVLRMANALLGLGIVTLTFLTVTLIFEKNRFAALSASAFVALNPMFMHISTLANNDGLNNFLLMLFLYLLVLSIKKGLDTKKAIVIGAVIGANLLTKFFAILALPIFFISIIAFRDSFKKSKEVIISLVIPLFLAGPYYIRNITLYKTIQPNYKFSVLTHNTFKNMSFTQYLFTSDFVKKLYISFWSNFGWIKPRYTVVYYQILNNVVILASIGFVIYLIKLFLKKEMFTFKTLCLFVSSFAILLSGIALNSYMGAKTTGIVEGVQGRYLFCLIGIIGLLIYLGLRQLLGTKQDYLAFVVLTIGIIVLDLSAIFYYILPYYYF